nr:hypothetical protein Iba_chr07aCG2940 [Ipomoea batatas]
MPPTGDPPCLHGFTASCFSLLTSLSALGSRSLSRFSLATPLSVLSLLHCPVPLTSQSQKANTSRNFTPDVSLLSILTHIALLRFLWLPPLVTPSPVSLLYRQCFVASPTLSGTVSS